MNKYLLLFLVFISIVTCSCKKSEISKSADETKNLTVLPDSDIVKDFIPPQDEYNTVSRCPVYKEKVTVDKNTKAVQYKGKTYYFCCPECVAGFKAEPKKYIK
ncbi:MAG: hypothetical protein A2539_01260 [Elusimicrobia bacterium RIFOXYD2_FULL_34_15]|nr:MAG: hypothetical protein A2539_01260 [Elusimicrobia bacterium RIFOXYD2_FULL_34_15]